MSRITGFLKNSKGEKSEFDFSGKAPWKKALELKKSPGDELTVERVEIDFSGKEVELPLGKFENKKIVIENLEAGWLEKGAIDSVIKAAEKRQFTPKTPFKWEIIRASEFKSKKAIDPTEKLTQIKAIKKYPFPGAYFWSPKGAKLLDQVYSIFKQMLDKNGYEQAVFPKVIPFEVWSKSGHVYGSGNEIYFLSPFKDRKGHQEIKNYFELFRELPSDQISCLLQAPLSGYTHSQCPPFYWYFENSELESSEIPVKWYDYSGPCLRYEDSPYGIIRLREIHKPEVVWMGTPKQIIEIRENLKSIYTRLFDLLELEYRLKWAESKFPANQEGLQEGQKQIGIFDFEAFLPKAKEWIEIGTLLTYGTGFTSRFGIKHKGGEKIYSGCSALGLDRTVAAVIAQHGLELPAALKKVI